MYTKAKTKRLRDCVGALSWLFSLLCLNNHKNSIPNKNIFFGYVFPFGQVMPPTAERGLSAERWDEKMTIQASKNESVKKID